MAAILPVTGATYDAQTTFNRTEAANGAGLCILRWDQYVPTQAGTGTVSLCKLPPGRIRIYPDFCRHITTAFEANADLHLGYAAYTNEAGTAVSADDNAFLDNADAGGGALDAAWVLPAIGYVDFNTQGGLVIQAMVDTGDMAVTDTLDGWVAYQCMPG